MESYIDTYYIYSILFGIFSKLFDDIIDNPIFRSIFGTNAEIAEEFFKAGMYSFSTSIIIHNPLFGLLFVLISASIIIGDKYFYKDIGVDHKAIDNNTWCSYIIFTILLTIITFILETHPDVNYLFFFITTTVICIGCIILEPYIMPENNSKRKMKFRLYGTFFLMFLIWNKELIQKYMPMNMDYYFYFLFFIIGYFSFSLIINHLYPYNPVPIHNKEE